MSRPQYVHLHLHTHYSVLDGVCQICPLLDRAKELEMKAMAITDHGAMYGAIDFYINAKDEKKGIKPIIGFEAYVAPGSRHEKSSHGMSDAAYHLTLLAKDLTGYRNLSKLCTLGYLEGYYYRPRIDKEILRQYGEGIIAMSGCLSGEVSRNLLNGRAEEAEAAAREYREIFGEENFFLEIQDNGLKEQKQIIPPMAALSKKLDIPLVATSDVHYILPEHARVQDVMICINTGKQLDDPNRMKMDTDEFYLKSAEQMRLTFKGYEAACDQTLAIAERCNLELPLSKNFKTPEEKFHLPIMAPEDGGTPEDLMHRECLEGLKHRYGDPIPEAVMDRYRKERDVINQMGFPSYFLMVGDIVGWSKDQGIAVGPGRGSAAGSIVAYALRITDLDPLKYDLLFERFLNEGRNEMPDIDLDFDKERRQEVVDYIVQRFGRDECAQIVTFGKMSAKSAVRDVGRVLGVPLHKVNVIAKMIPDDAKAKGGKTSIENAMEKNPDLAEAYRSDGEVKEMLDLAGTLDGVIRQTGIHAAGVLVADRPLADVYGPLAKRGEDITFQYDMKKVEELGLCKVDVLGLETLTLIRKAVENIQKDLGEEIDIQGIDLADKKVFRMLGRGDAKGVFQFESEGFRSLLLRLKPDRFEDLIAAVAMYRPGPLQCGMVDRYINCKHGREEVRYLHERMKPILEETYGEVLYQEQIQALAQDLAHFTLSEGDLMRRAMGKKIRAIMDEFRGKFVEQAEDTVGGAIAGQVFDQVEKFAEYGFNKSHSACYALIAYQTAWLKAHYPKQYMAALLTINRGDTKKIVEYSDDARRMGIEVLPPEINESGAYFTVSGDNIRFGLSAARGVGDKAVEMLEAERAANGPFENLYDFCERIDLRMLNKGAIEALIKAGAFDNLEGHRAQLVAALEGAISAGNAARKDRESGQSSLFGDVAEKPAVTLPKVPEWPPQEALRMEKEVLGFYVSSHPLALHGHKLEQYGTCTTGDLEQQPDGSKVTIGGMVTGVQVRTDKRDRRYGRFVLEDLEGSVGAVAFSSTFEAVKEYLEEDRQVFVRGKLDRGRDEPSILVDEVIPMELAEEKLSSYAVIALDAAGLSNDELDALKDLLHAHKGEKPLFFRVRAHNGKTVVVRAGHAFQVNPTNLFIEDMEKLMGPGKLYFSAKMAG